MVAQTPQHRGWQRMANLLVFGVLASAGCGVADNSALPPDVQAPETIRTPAGALARYRETLGELVSAFDGVMFTGGVLTDELVVLPLQVGVSGQYTGLDSRTDLGSSSTGPARRLQRLRAQAREARGFLNAYVSDSSPALRGHLFAIEAYAEVFLADLFCSGIPLSTVDFNGNYTLAAGSTTSEVYRHATELFDSALAVTDDSLRLQYLAAVGKGRALLGQGQYAAAAMAVAAVPDEYRYQLAFGWSFTTSVTTPPDSGALLWYATRITATNGGSSTLLVGAPRMANQEGGTGLNYRTSGDPRTLPWTRNVRSSPSQDTLYFPRKYTPNGATNAMPTNPVTFTMTSGIEARLIEAEAALRAGDIATWRSKLNHLRQTAWSQIVPAVTAPLDTLADPGTDNARVDLLFRERAFWLYLSAYRQGDLRRLIRQYARPQDTVYPTGLFYRGGGGVYGTEVVLPMPEEEQQLNPKYAGCAHRNA